MQHDDSKTVPAGSFSTSSGEAHTQKVDSGPTTAPTLPVEDFVEQAGAVQPTIKIGEEVQPTRAWLVLTTGFRAGKIYPLIAKGTMLGRDSQNDIVLDDNAVSRQHAKLRMEAGSRKSPGQFYIYDLGSANGVYVNDKKIVRKLLNDGDKVRVGETVLVFKSVDSPPAARRPAKKRAKYTTRKTKTTSETPAP